MVDDERPVLVTGGTGTLGRALVHTLLDAGRAVRVLSRRERFTGGPGRGGLGGRQPAHRRRAGRGGDRRERGRALRERPTQPDDDLDAAVQLLLAARAAAARTWSTSRSSASTASRTPYFKAKHRVEEIVEDGGVPWTILRATQFHDWVATMLDNLSRGPVAWRRRG